MRPDGRPERALTWAGEPLKRRGRGSYEPRGKLDTVTVNGPEDVFDWDTVDWCNHEVDVARVPRWSRNGRPGSKPDPMGFGRGEAAPTRSAPCSPRCGAVRPDVCGSWTLTCRPRSTRSTTRACWARSDRSPPGT